MIAPMVDPLDIAGLLHTPFLTRLRSLSERREELVRAKRPYPDNRTVLSVDDVSKPALELELGRLFQQDRQNTRTHTQTPLLWPSRRVAADSASASEGLICVKFKRVSPAVGRMDASFRRVVAK
jgi:hypothetical protein